MYEIVLRKLLFHSFTLLFLKFLYFLYLSPWYVFVQIQKPSLNLKTFEGVIRYKAGLL